ncbi:MAG: histidine kinase dimerization/phosphoacceptor domain -containing protein [Spirochaetota bacterium]
MSASDELRRKAEEIASARKALLPECVDPLLPEEIEAILHELRVHQVELEMQNEELRRVQERLEETAAGWFELYDLAPIGYVTIGGDKGLVSEANLMASSLLGCPRSQLIGKPFSMFVHEDGQDSLYLHRKALLETGKAQACELRLVKMNGTVFWAALQGNRSSPADSSYRIALMDVTECKHSEASQRDLFRQKEALIREIYHRANNNMQVISAILSFHAEALDDPRLTEAINDTQDRILSLAIVNRKLFEAKDLSRVNLRTYILELVAELGKKHKGRLKLVAELQDVFVLADTAIPCGLTLSELIGNSLRHAYPAGEECYLEIGLGIDATKTITIRVADRGIGVPADFEILKSKHIGLRSVVGLCSEQLEGSLRFDTAGIGFACEFSFRDNHYEARV